MDTSTVTRFFGRSVLIVKKFAPEILLGLGIASGIGTVILACKETLELDEVKRVNREMMEEVERGRENFDEDKYTPEQYRRDITVVTVRSIMNYAHLYGPSVALGLLSIGLTLASHGILSKRYAGAVAAYNMVNASFKEYRRRVIEDLDADHDSAYLHGVRDEVLPEGSLDENNNQIDEDKRLITTSDGNHLYTTIFSPEATSWRNSWENNIFFLQSQVNYMNHNLHSRGHVFLNEVYDNLGMPRTPDGAILGWVEGDGHQNNVDFGLNYPINDKPKGANWDERDVHLFFNVDGVIYEEI